MAPPLPVPGVSWQEDKPMENEDHEQHREAGAEDSGGALGAAGKGAGAPGVPIAYAHFTTSGAVFTSNTVYYTGIGSYVSGGGLQNASFEYCVPYPLEDGGIVVGEITAWRLWEVKPDGTLKSYAVENVWAPDEPMTGEPFLWGGHGTAGVYAFKTKEAFMREFGVCLEARFLGGYVWGEVSLWGEVVEHEDGYRAQYARIKRLYRGQNVSQQEYEAICRIYGVESVPGKQQPKAPLGRRLRRHAFPVIMITLMAMLGSLLLALACDTAQSDQPYMALIPGVMSLLGFGAVRLVYMINYRGWP